MTSLWPCEFVHHNRDLIGWIILVFISWAVAGFVMGVFFEDDD
jgi:hypothetical protein